MKKSTILNAVLSLLFLFSCEKIETNNSNWKTVDDSPVFKDWSNFQDITPASNAKSRNSQYAVFKAEYLTSAESGQVGRTVFFKDVGNKQSTADFVPGLQLDGTDNVSFYIDKNRATSDLSVEVSSAAIERAMQTWDDVKCSDLGMYQVPFNSIISTGLVSLLLGYGGSFDYVADIVHCGWMPGSFFDLLAPDGSDFILGVTFTIIFIDANGDPVDTDNNRKIDVAFREIYYNDNFTWVDGEEVDIMDIDVETVALHEAGHGLSQAHFGTAFRDAGGKKLHFSPKAVMNAGISSIQTTIAKTDNAGHCSLWSNWPVK